MTGKLIIVGTPIGNLSDFSPRAIETLQTCDFIAAEDTRVTVKLLNHFGIKKPMVSYFEHNKMERGDIICNRMEQGEVCVLVSDAGMPAISDPGELLVAQCVQRNIPVYKNNKFQSNMQNKGFVKVFAVLLTLVCVFYLSFSFVTRYHMDKAAQDPKGEAHIQG